MTSPTKQEPARYQYCWKCKTLNPEGHYCACVCRKSPPYVRADAYTALQATVAERDARVKELEHDLREEVRVNNAIDAEIATLRTQLAEARDQLQASQCAEQMSSDLLAEARRNEARLTIAVEALTEIESHGRVDGTGMIAEDLARRALDEIGKLP